jgi:hypothetical protein
MNARSILVGCKKVHKSGSFLACAETLFASIGIYMFFMIYGIINSLNVLKFLIFENNSQV